jgi:lactate permease
MEAPMIYLLWLLPTFVVAIAIGSGRLNASSSALLGLLVAAPIAALTGPEIFGLPELSTALSRGFWIGVTIAPYIIGGLLFWQVAMHNEPLSPAPLVTDEPANVQLMQRKTAFFACFLIGPFAESATGFGVGMLGTIALLRSMRIAPAHLMVFALLSQTLIPWGAMGSGTILAAAYARMSPADLSFYSIVPVSLLMLLWLPLFWRTAAAAGLKASKSEHIREAAWIAAGMASLAFATKILGPETGLLAAFGPLIALRFLCDKRPTVQQIGVALKRIAPYVLLICGLVATRVLPDVKQTLTFVGRVSPYSDLPAWAPFYHAGTWLIVGALITAVVRGQLHLIGREAKTAMKTGKHAILTVFIFAMMAEILSVAGISHAFAQGMFSNLESFAILFAPFTSAAFGILANSGNAPNSLFMPSQYALALQAGLSVPAVAALQHASGTCMSIFSPVRMSIAAGLADGRGQERVVYKELLPYAAAAVLIFFLIAVFVSKY